MVAISSEFNFSMRLIRVSKDHTVKSGSIWRGEGSSLAVSVVTVTNSTATETERYPETVIFLDQGKLKSLALSAFKSRYERLMTGDCPDLRLELSKWLHEKSGTTYTVLLRTAETDPVIIYTDTANLWSRLASDWERSMKRTK